MATINGTNEGDFIIGTVEGDSISAFDGNDTIDGGLGDDQIDGGAGIDTVTYITASGAVDVFLGPVTGSSQGAAGLDAFLNVENAIGSNFDDFLTGSDAATAGPNSLFGMGGNDQLSGGFGDDALDGGVGDDVLRGGVGDDFIDGGEGNDTVSYITASGGVEVVLDAGGFADGADGFDTLLNVENAIGSNFDDVLAGNEISDGGRAGPNSLFGMGGNDQLSGGFGDDTLDGGNGNDFLRGGAGFDTIDGGSGVDTVSYSTAGGPVEVNLRLGFADEFDADGSEIVSSDRLVNIENANGSAFGDVLSGDDADNVLQGLDGDDAILGNGGNDTLNGGNGNDFLRGGAGSDTINGGSGVDTVSYINASGGVEVFLDAVAGFADGADGLDTVLNVENAIGSDFDDILTGNGISNGGNAGPNSLFGMGGNDVLRGGFGGDTLDGGNGNDILDGGLGDDRIDGGDGIDTATYANASGAISVNLVNPAIGAAFGAAGVDTLFNIENVIGSAFDDILSGNAAANVFDGGAGNDLLLGGGGGDTLIGGAGDDFLRGSDGADTLTGGSGFDRVSSFLTMPTVGVTINLNLQGIAQNTGHGLDTLLGIEHASGTILDDTLTGDGGANWLWGGSDGSGSGITGNDTISGGGGDDLVEVGNGNHALDGGTGIDTLSFLGGTVDVTTAGVTFSLALQGAAQDSEQGLTSATGFENLSGSIHDDNLAGDNGDNIIAGDRGDDTLSGGRGNDTLIGDGRIHVDTHDTGGSGPITLFDDITTTDPDLVGGDDILDGGRGDDVLFGGRGNDVMAGGQGGDTFVIEALSGNDQIIDFGSLDTILFDALSGVDDFSDLILTAVGKGTSISWGTGDSLLVQGVSPGRLSASDFSFESNAAASNAAVMDSFSHGSSFHAVQIEMGGAAIDIASLPFLFG